MSNPLFSLLKRIAPPPPPRLSELRLPSVDSVLSEMDKALRTLASKPVANRPNPSASLSNTVGLTPIEGQLADGEKADVIGMMRVNHVGEICAQALYQGQALASADPAKKALFMHAAEEEADHLAWTLTLREGLFHHDGERVRFRPFPTPIFDDNGDVAVAGRLCDLGGGSSLVVDETGIYFDPRTPSALENILQQDRKSTRLNSSH